MALHEEDVFEDLAYEEAEGEADAYEESEEFEGMEGFEEFEQAEAGEELEEDGSEAMEQEGFEEFESMEEGEDYGEMEASDEETFEDAMAYALGAEDTDEFFRRIARLARRAAPIIGRVARIAGPILSRIPHPAAQIAGRVAGIAGRLLPQAEDDALDAFAELAVRDRRAIPIVAGLAVRRVIGPRVAAMPPAARRAAVHTIARAARTLMQRGGPQSVRALPKITRSVHRTAVARRTPAPARPQVVRRTAARVVARPGLVGRLSRPSPRARQVIRAALRRGGPGVGRVEPGVRAGRIYRINRPVEIIVRAR